LPISTNTIASLEQTSPAGPEENIRDMRRVSAFATFTSIMRAPFCLAAMAARSRHHLARGADNQHDIGLSASARFSIEASPECLLQKK
jgi:hypothetical protein